MNGNLASAAEKEILVLYYLFSDEEYETIKEQEKEK
jgi:hypothetical protein